jgi:hypothetical protein
MATAVMLVHAAPALARTNQLPSSLTLSASGSLTVTWHGDVARGCAAAGLCGTDGEVILRPSTGSEGLGSSGPISELSVALVGTVRVRRVDGQSTPAECVEPISEGFGGGLQLVLARHWAATLQPAPTSGRCAGPLGADLAGLALPLGERGGRYPRFDLRGTRAFTAGPFSGQIVSSMDVLTAPATGQSSFSSTSFSGSFPPGSVPRRRILREFVALRFRLSIAPSALREQFAGTPAPDCNVLDSCGTTGSLSLSLTHAQAPLMLVASRVVHARASRGRALTDYRDGRLGLSYPATAPASAQVVETLTRPDGSSCNDATTVSGLDLVATSLGANHGTGRVQVSLEDQSLPGDVLRTHCSGPAGADVTGEGGGGQGATLGRGSLAPAQLLSPMTDISLSDPGSFAGLGYAGERGGAVKLRLTLVHVAAGTEVLQ